MTLAQDDTMIRIPKTLRETLKGLQITPNEPYYNIIERLIKASEGN